MSQKSAGKTAARMLPKVLLVGVACIGLSWSGFTLPAERSAKLQITGQKTAQQAFKNIQVLKDIPADQLLPAMQFMTASLGVECDHCHVHDAFEKDDKKPKQTARRMMQMMFAINDQNFEGKRQVTCQTCHRGSAKPLGTPAIEGTTANIDAWETPPAQIASGTDLPPASDVLEKYIVALGGASAIERVSSRLESGSVTFGAGPSWPVEILTKAPNKQIMTVRLTAGDSSTAINGQSGWTSVHGSPVREMSQSDLEGARLDADLQFALHLSKTFSELRIVEGEPVDGRPAILLLARNPEQPPLELYFDKESCLLLRQVRFAKSPLGLNPTRIDYADYKDFDGVKVPLHVTVVRPNRRLDIQVIQVKQNVAVSDSKFEHE